MSSIQECIWVCSWCLLLAEITSVLALSSLLLLVHLLIELRVAVGVFLIATTITMMVERGRLGRVNLLWDAWSTDCMILEAEDLRMEWLLLWHHFLFSHLKFALSLLQMTSCLQKML